MRFLTLLLLCVSLSAQTPAKFSYTTTLSLEVTARGFDRELRSELAREFERIDGVQIVTDSQDRIVEIVAVKTPDGLVAAAVAVTSTLQHLLDFKLLLQPENPPWSIPKLGETRLMLNLIVFTSGGDLRDLARRIVGWVHSDHLIPDRDMKYRFFQAQHPDPR